MYTPGLKRYWPSHWQSYFPPTHSLATGSLQDGCGWFRVSLSLVERTRLTHHRGRLTSILFWESALVSKIQLDTQQMLRSFSQTLGQNNQSVCFADVEDGAWPIQFPTDSTIFSHLVVSVWYTSSNVPVDTSSAYRQKQARVPQTLVTRGSCTLLRGH